jgi:hypothetical protein
MLKPKIIVTSIIDVRMNTYRLANYERHHKGISKILHP